MGDIPVLSPIFGNGDVDSRTATTVTLADTAGLLRIPFDKRELKARKTRLETIAAGDATSGATEAAIAAARAAMVAILAATTATTVTTITS